MTVGKEESGGLRCFFCDSGDAAVDVMTVGDKAGDRDLCPGHASRRRPNVTFLTRSIGPRSPAGIFRIPSAQNPKICGPILKLILPVAESLSQLTYRRTTRWSSPLRCGESPRRQGRACTHRACGKRLPLGTAVAVGAAGGRVFSQCTCVLDAPASHSARPPDAPTLGDGARERRYEHARARARASMGRHLLLIDIVMRSWTDLNWSPRTQWGLLSLGVVRTQLLCWVCRFARLTIFCFLDARSSVRFGLDSRITVRTLWCSG